MGKSINDFHHFNYEFCNHVAAIPYDTSKKPKKILPRFTVCLQRLTYRINHRVRLGHLLLDTASPTTIVALL